MIRVSRGPVVVVAFYECLSMTYDIASPSAPRAAVSGRSDNASWARSANSSPRARAYSKPPLSATIRTTVAMSASVTWSLATSRSTSGRDFGDMSRRA